MNGPAARLPFPLLSALRPRQWIKNALVLAALVFSGKVLETALLARAVLGAVLFCLVSSGVYLINDIADAEKDRLHPIKRLRPIAAGTLSVPRASWTACFLICGPVAGGVLLAVPFGLILGAYAALSIAYSWRLKHVPLVDVFVLSSGFVLRAASGAVVIGVEISDWFFICTLLLALFVSLNKRRAEITLLGDANSEHRAVLSEYPSALLDQVTGAVTGAIIVCYSLYTVWPQTVQHVGSTNLKYTIPFVMFGLFRYLYLVHLRDKGGAPEQVFLTDRGMILTVIGWAVTVFLVIYGPAIR